MEVERKEVAKETCCICWEDGDVQVCVFLPCRCRVRMCAACCASVKACLYHGGEPPCTIAEFSKLVAELVQMRAVMNQLRRINMELKAEADRLGPLARKAKLMGYHVLQNSIIWIFAFTMHQMAYAAMNNYLLGNVFAGSALFLDVLFLVKHSHVHSVVLKLVCAGLVCCVVSLCYAYAPRVLSEYMR